MRKKVNSKGTSVIVDDGADDADDAVGINVNR